MKRSRRVVVGSLRMSERRREVRAHRRRRILRIVVVMAVAGGLGAGGVAIGRSQLFAVSSITVTGVDAVPESAVRAAAGIVVGQNTVGLDLAAAARRVAALEGIRAAQVERAGALGIRIAVRERVAAVEVRAQGRRWFTDDQGVPVATGPARGLPVVDLGPLPRVAEPIVLGPGPAADVVSVWRGLTPKLRARVSRFDRPAPGRIVFHLDQMTVVLGGVENLAAKLDAMRLVLARLPDKRIARIDLRVPERPAARLL